MIWIHEPPCGMSVASINHVDSASNVENLRQRQQTQITL